MRFTHKPKQGIRHPRKPNRGHFGICKHTGELCNHNASYCHYWKHYFGIGYNYNCPHWMKNTAFTRLKRAIYRRLCR